MMQMRRSVRADGLARRSRLSLYHAINWRRRILHEPENH